MRRGMLFEKFRVIRQNGQLILFDIPKRVCQSHVSVRLVMPVGLAVGGDVRQLWTIARLGKDTHQAIGKSLAVLEEIFECNATGNGTVIEKNRNVFPGLKV